MRRLALALLAAAVLVGGAAGATPKRSIAITGTTVTDGVVTVKVAIRGWKLYPALVGKKPRADGGHWHIFVDGKYNGFSARLTGKTKKLAPGPHRIVVSLANNNHAPLRPDVRSKVVTVTVTAPPAGETPPEDAPPEDGY